MSSNKTNDVNTVPKNRLGKIGNRVIFFLSLPWCCLLSMGALLMATSGAVAGIVFDEYFHSAMPVVIPILVLLHLYGICRYAVASHKTRGQTLFLVATTILFVLSISFHFTDLHDLIVHGQDHS